MPADSRDMVLVPRDVVDRTLYAMARGYERLHSLPRITDTVLADQLEAAKVALRDAALSASPARGEGDAPVAWRGRDLDAFGDGAWAVCSFKPSCDVVEPLYTHLTPATPAGEELREKVARIVDPKSWAIRDGQYENIERSPIVCDKKQAQRCADTYVTDSLKKTDAILAALQPQAQPAALSPETDR